MCWISLWHETWRRLDSSWSSWTVWTHTWLKFKSQGNSSQLKSKDVQTNLCCWLCLLLYSFLFFHFLSCSVMVLCSVFVTGRLVSVRRRGSMIVLRKRTMTKQRKWWGTFRLVPWMHPLFSVVCFDKGECCVCSCLDLAAMSCLVPGAVFLLPLDCKACLQLPCFRLECLWLVLNRVHVFFLVTCV